MSARNLLRMFAACVALVWPALGSAHQGTGAHGGQLADAGPYYVELIHKENQLQVFVFDDKTSAAVQMAQASATATVLAGEDKQTVTLKPGPPGTDNNEMVGQLQPTAVAVTRVLVLIKLPDKPSIIARFAF